MKALQYKVEGYLLAVYIIIGLFFWYKFLRLTLGFIPSWAWVLLLAGFLHTLSVIFRFLWSLVKMGESEGVKGGKKLSKLR